MTLVVIENLLVSFCVLGLVLHELPELYFILNDELNKLGE